MIPRSQALAHPLIHSIVIKTSNGDMCDGRLDGRKRPGGARGLPLGWVGPTRDEQRPASATHCLDPQMLNLEVATPAETREMLQLKGKPRAAR